MRSVVHLDEPRQVIICLTTGRNELVRMVVRATLSLPDVVVGFGEAEVISGRA